jgi:hypothetical protein
LAHTFHRAEKAGQIAAVDAAAYFSRGLGFELYFAILRAINLPFRR